MSDKIIRATKPFDVVWMPDLAGFAVADADGGKEQEYLFGVWTSQSEAQEVAAIWARGAKGIERTPEEQARLEQLFGPDIEMV